MLAGCLYALITGRRPVSRRNRACWYLNQLNKVVRCETNDCFQDDEPTHSSPIDPDLTIVNDQEQTVQSNRDIVNNKVEENSTSDTKDVKVTDIKLISVTSYQPDTSLTLPEVASNDKIELNSSNTTDNDQQQFLVTPNTRVIYLSRSIATSILLDLSPSVVSVSSQNGCVFLDSMFDAIKRVLHLLVKEHEIPSSSIDNSDLILNPKVFVSVIAYTPFVVAKNNQVLMQNRRISSSNIDQVLVELWLCLSRLTQEIYELVGNTYGLNSDYDTNRSTGNIFFPPNSKVIANSGIIRQPGAVLEDIFELGLFSSSLMPRLSRLSIIIISDGLFSSSNNLNTFRQKNIAVSFISLSVDSAYPDACFGYTPYIDLMKFISKTTLGIYLSHQDLINSSHSLSKTKHIPFLSNPLGKLFCWTLHSDMLSENQFCDTPKAILTNFEQNFTSDTIEITADHVSRYFCIDQPIDNQTNGISDKKDCISSENLMVNSNNYHDWRSFRQLDRNLDADFEQVLACLLREGYLIKYIQFKRKETTRIVARLVLHWKHNLDLEQELSAPCWNNTNMFGLDDSNHQLIPSLRPFNTPQYGDTYCEIIVHGSYSFLHNLYCDKKSAKRRTEFRDTSYKQYRQLIDSVMQTQERLQYLSRFYRDSSLSKVPSFLLHGNSLLYEQPHTNRLTSTIENVLDESKTSEFQEYWQKMSCLDTKSWKNLMHIHSLRLVLEHDQPKHKNIHYQNANGRYTHVQCRRALSAISNFIKSYSSFALLEDSTYIKFIYNKDDDLREIETSATKGFIVIRIQKLLPIVVIYLMFTSGILDSHRIKIVSYIESQLVNCKLRNTRASTVSQVDNILKSKIISPSGDSACILLRSPLERMLKVYNRNYINEFLLNNLSHGLPGSCPYTVPWTNNYNSNNRPGTLENNHSTKHTSHHASNKSIDTNPTSYKEPLDGYSANSSINQYNLIFGKYLYGIRTVHTIANLPNDLLNSLAANVLSKISAILVNIRIKEGFHIAFNNSGILNLVVELEMQDHSNQDHSSSSLCQYVVFPPTVTSLQPTAQSSSLSAVLSTSNNSNSVTGSKPSSLSGSLVNSDSYMKTSVSMTQESSLQNQQQQSMSSVNMRSANNNKGEIKIIKEYWIEQQYGISTESKNYHKALKNMRYSEVVDHLFRTDSTIFECLLTYDLLQLMCDKLSLYYELDLALASKDQKQSPLFSPISNTTNNSSTTSSSILDQQDMTSSGIFLPSTLIEGNTRDGNPKVPLLELEYKFSLTKFLDYCQQASLNVLLFKDRSEHGCSVFYDFDQDDFGTIRRSTSKKISTVSKPDTVISSSTIVDGSNRSNRKTSFDINDLELSGEHNGKREHRSSYQNDNSSACYTYTNPMYSPSLNHMMLETLHRRLKQMHEKELKLSSFDLDKLPAYLKRRKLKTDEELYAYKDDSRHKTQAINILTTKSFEEASWSDTSEENDTSFNHDQAETIEWRCYLRKGNQENLMIVLVPVSLIDVKRWLKYVNSKDDIVCSHNNYKFDPVCPMFVFRCSSTMINDNVMSFLNKYDEYENEPIVAKGSMESDLSLHFGQSCKYMGRLQTLNDELSVEILPNIGINAYNQTNNDEKTLEAVHFRAFLRKIKNTVLKSRFSSLNDAYLSELFIHKEDILYYINNVDFDTQKKYHVSAQLKGLADFIKNYEDYVESLPKEPVKECNQLLNSILLQKCGLFINQPIVRFDETNPLIKQLHDKKLLFLIRSNYKIELPILEENLADSMLLKNFVKINGSTSNIYANCNHNNQHFQNNSTTTTTTNNNNNCDTPSLLSTSLGRNGNTDSSRHLEMKCGSVGTSNPVIGSPSSIGFNSSYDRHQQPKFVNQQTRYGSNTTLNSLSSSMNKNIILEAFKGIRSCSIEDIDLKDIDENDIALRHEAHMAEVLLRRGEKKESNHYRRVLRSKGNYNQSHGAIDQALKRVDSLGRLEHFCLTPLLFSPEWRSKLAPVRDHTIESFDGTEMEHYKKTGTSMDPRIDVNIKQNSPDQSTSNDINILKSNTLSSNENNPKLVQQDSDERWHIMVCNNYIKEYEQYIQTLGFNSVQIRYQTNTSTGNSALSNSNNIKPGYSGNSPIMTSARSGLQQYFNSPTSKIQTAASSVSASNSSLLNSNSNSTSNAPLTYNTGYLIKFLNSGCLVFKVGFCKPYVYSILYSIEGERFNNSNVKLNMTSFLDELDNIKVTMHLHSFTYDYHLRSMYSYISGRQLTFNPGYHLISFLDDFRKYYQKAPNYARNHILSGEICITDIKVTGQQLYNYIVTHNSTYNMEVLEMSNAMSNLISDLSSKALLLNSEQTDQLDQLNSTPSQLDNNSSQQLDEPNRNHANDYVLIELKREKVRYRDGKDPDVFDCGLLITHNFHQSYQDSSKNNLTLKYFLLLTNQRDLYPKLIHTYDSIITSGCHRPIRLCLANQQQANIKTTDQVAEGKVGKLLNKSNSSVSKQTKEVAMSTVGSDLDDAQSRSELQSSGEVSGPTSILSSYSTQSSSTSSGLQFGPPIDIHRIVSQISNNQQTDDKTLQSNLISTSIATSAIEAMPKIKVETSNKEQHFFRKNESNHTIGSSNEDDTPIANTPGVEGHGDGSVSPSLSVKSLNHRQRNNSTGSAKSKKNYERTICDEEITYLGYFSSDEMDVLKFLQQKTNNLRNHIEQVVKKAEVHYRRDYLWHKLMQRSAPSAKSDDVLLSTEDLVQLLAIVEAIDLSVLDPQLQVFTSMHTNWYQKLIKSFMDMKQQSTNQHRIYSVKASKQLLLYIDPNCTTAFILLSVDQERGSVEMNMLMKDKQQCSRISSPKAATSISTSSNSNSNNNQSTSSSAFSFNNMIDLDQDCQQLMNDFINFCAAFLWSTLLN